MALLLCLTGSAHAQNAESDPVAERMFRGLDERIQAFNLTDAQREKIGDIRQEESDKLWKRLPEFMNASPEKQRELMRPIADELRNRVRPVLTADQNRELDLWREKEFPSPTTKTAAMPATTRAAEKDAPVRPAAGRGGERGGMMIGRLIDQVQALGLTEEQKQELKPIADDFRDKVRGMLPELRDAAPAQRAEKMRGLFRDFREQVRDVLTPDQNAKLDDSLKQMRDGPRENVPRENPPRVEPTPPTSATQPTTRPAPAPSPGAATPAGGRGNLMLDRMQASLDSLSLTDDQKSKVDAVIAKAREKAADLRDAAANGDDVRERVREIQQQTREELAGILTPDQQAKLREAMARGPANRAAPPEKVPESPADKPAMKPDEPAMKSDEPTMKPDTMQPESPVAKPKAAVEIREKPPGPSASPPAAAAAAAAAATVAIGQVAPPLSAERPDNRPIDLKTSKNRIVVLIFGSYSSPTFREQAASIIQLRKQTAAKADWIVIYTKEAYAVGEWEIDRNTDAGIQVAQPKTYADRKRDARVAKDKLGLGDLTLAVDDMSNATAAAYGAGPHSAVVIGRDGKIFARQQWAEPFALKRLVDEASRPTPATAPGKAE